MSFSRPLLLVLLLLPVWWLWRRRRRPASAPGYSDTALVAEASRGAWVVRLPPVLRAIGLVALVIGIAGPRVGGDQVETKQEGIAIAIALDLSSSMLEKARARVSRTLRIRGRAKVRSCCRARSNPNSPARPSS